MPTRQITHERSGLEVIVENVEIARQNLAPCHRGSWSRGRMLAHLDANDVENGEARVSENYPMKQFRKHPEAILEKQDGSTSKFFTVRRQVSGRLKRN